MSEFGYAGEILKVDLSDGKITKLPTAPYADKYVGGHGIAARLYWEMVPPQAKALDPENCFICGWDIETGLPKKATLEELGLKDVAADLAGRGLLK